MLRRTVLIGTPLVLASMVLGSAIGCSGGTSSGKKFGGSSGGSSGGATGGFSSGGAGSGPALSISEAQGLPATFSVAYDARNAAVNALVVAATGADVLVRTVVLTAAGTANDAADIAAVKIAVDDGDGVFNARLDRMIGGIARYGADNGRAVLGGLQHTVASGSAELWWIVYDLAGTAHPAETIRASVESPSDVDAAPLASSQPLQITGLPARGPEGTVFLGEHLMISEICVQPTNGEFIEIFNPTARPIDLSDVYLSDAEDWKATSPYNPQHYWNLPSGRDFGLDGPQKDYDFVARFPAGATIQPGQYVVVAFDSDKFKSQYGKDPDFEIRQDGTADGVADMRIPGPRAVSTTAGLTNERECVILFRWDGQSDLVEDLDIVEWGDDLSGFYVDKSGVQIDGPDQDSIASAYRADQSMIMHDKARPNAIGTSMKRVDFSEWGEVKTGGNGVSGHDETSENWATTWSNLTPPTPGTN
jgi:hypothetical protein